MVNMEDGYEQTLHRRRRNDRLIFHESEEKEFLYDEMNLSSN